MKAKKSWREKLADSKDLPRIVPIPESLRKWGSGTMLIPAPTEVDAIMKKVSRGKVITMNEIRSLLARKHGATIACPITTGIFGWIAAHAAEEERKSGGKRVTPYWRTLKTGGILNEKYPGGIEEQREKLESEGHRIVKRGKEYVVEIPAGASSRRLKKVLKNIPKRRYNARLNTGIYPLAFYP